MNDPVEIPKRKNLTRRQRVKLFDSHGGICCLCKTKIQAGDPWIDEHIDPLAISGDNDLANRGPAHVACANEKTKKDQKDIAKVYRIRANHLGVKKRGRPIPGSKASGWKRKFDGTVVRRY